MVRVRKRDGTTEEYVESKIVSGVKKAGATAQEATRVTKDVTKQVARKAEVRAEELSDIVVKCLEKVNKAASKEFVRFRDAKLKSKKGKP